MGAMGGNGLIIKMRSGPLSGMRAIKQNVCNVEMTEGGAGGGEGITASRAVLRCRETQRNYQVMMSPYGLTTHLLKSFKASS